MPTYDGIDLATLDTHDAASAMQSLADLMDGDLSELQSALAPVQEKARGDYAAEWNEFQTAANTAHQQHAHRFLEGGQTLHSIVDDINEADRRGALGFSS
jgi:uncharacterized protein YukE